MLSTIQQLREVAVRCRQGEALPEPVAAWLARSLDDFLSHRSPTIEQAMGIRHPRGGVPWWMEEAIRKRDGALRALAERLLPGASAGIQARQIHALAVRYAAAGWTLERELEEPPPGHRGKPQEHLWLAFKSGAPMPIGPRQIRSILAR